jgi:2-methylisocitrate lyase-like PEP mutase family enzyme
VDAGDFAEHLAALREAGAAAGVGVVLNARIDTYFHGIGADADERFAETLRRARLYVEAGADCVYPIRLIEPEVVARLVRELGTPVNANLGPRLTVADVAATGAARISVGPSVHGAVMAELQRRATELLATSP